MKRLFGFCVVLILGVRRGLPYNLETQLPLFKYGTKGSKFGYSVALHRLSAVDSVDTEMNTLMVAGAPRATYALNDVPAKMRPESPGGLFSCPMSTTHDDCSRVTMDKGGNYNGSSNGHLITYTKDDQWLGVSVKSQGTGKFLVTCAHRFRQVINPGGKDDEGERMCGKCFLLKARNVSLVEIPPDSEELPRSFVSSPCEIYQTGNHQYEHKNRYGPMQSGTSIDITSNSYVYGAPGAYAWTGALFDFALPTGDNDRSRNLHTPTCYYKGEREDSELGVWRCTKIPVPRDSYLGLSVATSSGVDTDDDTLYYAAGAPTGNQTGAVVFFKRMDSTATLSPDRNKTVYGDRVHSSFGYSVVLTDINGDGLDDLIVGAPQYYEISQIRKAGGAVYVYLNKDKEDFSAVIPHVIYGQLKSYFGHSIAALGDIDQDGFNDFAIGAPYEGDGGVVHIYRGGEDGPKKSQVIKSTDYGFVTDEFQQLVGFGSSLSGNVDADGNNYPDLLIGSYSDTIALLRSRPIISVTGELDVAIEELDLDVKNCTSDGSPLSCFEISYCLRFEARKVQYDGVPIKHKIVLDDLSTSGSRLFIDAPIDGTLTLQEGVRRCPGNRQKVYFNDEYADKLTDIEITFEFELDNPPVEREKEGDPVFKMIGDPILDRDLENVFKKKIKIKNTCGDDGCQSDLVVHATIEHEVFIGEDKLTSLTVTVENLGEEAHQAYIGITLPQGVRYDKSEINDPSLPGMRCYSESISLTRCDLGNPYEHGMKDEIIVSLSTEALGPDTKTIDVTVIGSTTSQNPKIVPIKLEAIVLIEVDLAFRGFGFPEQVRYELRPIIGESAVTIPEEIGARLIYNYEVSNSGLHPVNGISINVQLPIEIFNGKWLLYPFDSSVTTGSGISAGNCNTTNINILKLESYNPASAIFAPKRNKRSAEEPPVAEIPVPQALSTEPGRYGSRLVLTCDNSKCVNITCALGELDPATTTSLALQVHLWEATFLEEYRYVDLINIRSSAILESENKNLRFKGGNSIADIRTTVDHGELSEESSYAFPWWYILIGVIIILIIYIIIIIAFVKCGFFKRKRFPREEEEPLNTDDKRVDEEKEEDEF